MFFDDKGSETLVPVKRVHAQQLDVKHIGSEELVVRRLELKTSLRDKRSRLLAAQEATPERGYARSKEAWEKREVVILDVYRRIQELSREIEAEEDEVARINRRIRALNLPYGVVRVIENELQKAERR